MPPTKTGKDIPCNECGEEIYVPKWRLESNDNHFCSNECHNRFQTTRLQKVCPTCGEKFETKEYDEKEYCSRTCGYESRKSQITVQCHVCSSDISHCKSRVENQDKFYCSKQCRSEKLSEKWTGENNPRYVDGEYNGFGDNWLNIRERVWSRANNECEWCSKTTKENGRRLSVHHIIPRRKFINHKTLSVNDANFMKNLIALCQSCHSSAECGNGHYPTTDKNE